MCDSHPLEGIALHICQYKCFGAAGGGFEAFKPINIVIGRNNTGKSALIDVVELCISRGGSFDEAKHSRGNSSFELILRQKIDRDTLIRVFPKNHGGGGVPGPTHWGYGRQFVGRFAVRRYARDWNASFVDNEPDFRAIQDPSSREGFYSRLAQALPWPFDGVRLIRISAERDVQPEKKDPARFVRSNGAGTTNLIRAFITSDDLPREEVEQNLLSDLNTIYRGDSEFTQIICQEDSSENWEIFVREERKGDIRLSQSGSSLKSIFIILCMLRLLPHIENVNWENVIFSVEEPENNLHPALLRRLLEFLADQRRRKRFALIITTHSPISIDWSASRSDSQIIHLIHDGNETSTRTATRYLHNRDILDDLDVRASDILQSNGVIWIEGPSDRIYLRHWIELASDGRLKEGVHYSMMFYAGKLLAHVDALPPDESEELISLLSINRNAAVVIDSDRRPGSATGRKPRMNLNETKRRVKEEIERIDGFVWITEGKEIENYTPIEVFARVAEKRPPKDVDQYTEIIKLPTLKKFKKDKVALAHAAAPATTREDLENHLDIWSNLETLCSHIERWNGISA